MSLIRTAGRTMLASIFIYAGVDALRDPRYEAEQAADLVDEMSDRVEQIPNDAEMVVRAAGAVQVLGGLALATNTMARPAAVALAGTLVPATAVGHRFWEIDQEAPRKEQLLHFLKNVGLLGGLLITAMDTQGEPGVAWRAQHAVDQAGLLADHKKEVAGLQAELARERAHAAATIARERARAGTKVARSKAEVAKQKAKSETAGARARIGATGRAAKREAKMAKKAGKAAGKVAASTGRALATAGKSTASAVKSAMPG